MCIRDRFKSFDSISGVDADVIIDFSHPSVLRGLLEYASANKCPAVDVYKRQVKCYGKFIYSISICETVSHGGAL